MSAQQAAKEYGLKKKGNKVMMKNSGGNTIEVDKNTKVYHRGNKKFALYSNARDKGRQSQGINQLKPGKKTYKVGEGAYRHTHDGKKGFKKRR